MANVMLLFKKGATQETGNYRPVSLTSTVDKISKFIMNDEIAEYLEVHDKTGLSHHSFVKGRSCLTNLLEFFEDVTSKLDKAEPVDVIYFKKAFDKV
eukprot:g30423.t1